MNKIHMVDLKSQYNKLKPELDRAIQSVIDSSSFIRGPEVGQFEEELAKYLGVKHVISCGNGTDALQIAMMGLGLKPGDEVITTDFTFIATVEVIALLGLKPVFIDPDPDTFIISPQAVEKAITPKTRVILPVHLFGQCADMEAIIAISQKHNLFIIEDTAQANGTEYKFSDGRIKKAGTMGDIGCTSFFPSKNLGCYGDGGAMFTNDDKLAALLRSISNHGMTKKYYHDHIGVNSRLDALQAAILRVKLKYLDSYNNARLKAASFYNDQLSSVDGIIIPVKCENSSHIYHQYTIKVHEESRDELKNHLAACEIPSMVYYPVPLHRQQAYSYLKLDDNSFPLTNKLSKQVLSLPMHTELSLDQLTYITKSIIEFFE